MSGKKLLAGMLALCAALTTLGGCSRSVNGEKTSSAPVSSAPVTGGGTPEPGERLPTLAEVDDPYHYVTQNIDFGLPGAPAFLHPAGEVTVAAAAYYLTGITDPQQPALLNGEPLETRGENGSFALSAPLQAGDNVFTLQQGEQKISVTIRRGAAQTAAPTTDKVTKMQPETDLAVEAGSSFTLQCVAPAGGTVTAQVGGETLTLQQNAVAQPGVPATFSAGYHMPEKDGISEVGTVTYFLNGAPYPSNGRLFSIAPGSRLLVQIQNAGSSVFAAASVNSPVMTTGRKGAVDEVVEFGGDAASGEMYRLGMGGWIQAAAASPVVEEVQPETTVTSSSFSRDGEREVFTFHGNGRPFYQASQTQQALTLRFYRTAGIKPPDLAQSKLFSSFLAEDEEGDTVLTFELAEPGVLWGYWVEYEGTDTRLICLPRPAPGPADLPLQGILVAVDAGHGGSDTGTLGLPYDAAPMEKDVTIATAEALKKQLGLLGARVVMVREGDENPTMNRRMEQAREAWADFYISLHGNGAGYTSELIAAKGIEVYYFEPVAAALAKRVCTAVSTATGRVNRGAHQANYRVTMQSFAPAILVELGFLPNPEDFDSLCDKEQIYNTVTAICDALVAELAAESGTGADMEKGTGSE